ncbi:MAG: hypothetical protein DMF66_11065 [Acidobacteria bacterium]|nr:MAG: hypothetical protein DMF66_11065 [Acidobacteriota bacterium]
MKILHKEVVASVRLVEIRMSEDELAVLEATLSYILDTLGKEINRRLGAKRDEVEGIRDELREALCVRNEAEPVAEMSEKS